MRELATRLHESLSAVCPIDGVSIGNPADKSSWRIDYASAATPAQRAAARTALQAFDPASADAVQDNYQSAMAALKAQVNGKSASTLTQAELRFFLLYMMHERDWVASDGKVQVP